MTIRARLIGAFLLVALLVLVLGSIAVARVRGITRDVAVVNQEAAAAAQVATELAALQQEQQRAIAASLASGGAAERPRADELVAPIDQTLAELTRTTERLMQAQQETKAAASRTERLLVVVTLGAVVLAAAFGTWFAGAITQPLRDLRDATTRLSLGDLDTPPPASTTRDEVGDLAAAVRRMAVSLRVLLRSRADPEADSESEDDTLQHQPRAPSVGEQGTSGDEQSQRAPPTAPGR